MMPTRMRATAAQAAAARLDDALAPAVGSMRGAMPTRTAQAAQAATERLDDALARGDARAAAGEMCGAEVTA